MGPIPYRPMVRGHFDRFSFVNATDFVIESVDFVVDDPSGSAFVGGFAAVDPGRAPSATNCGANNEGLWTHIHCDAVIAGQGYIYDFTVPAGAGNIFFAALGMMQDCQGNLMMFGEVKLEQGEFIALQDPDFIHP